MKNDLETVKVILEVSGEPTEFWLMIGDEKERIDFRKYLNTLITSSKLYQEKK